MFNKVTIKSKTSGKSYVLSTEQIDGKELATLTLAEMRDILNEYDDHALGSDKMQRDEYHFWFKETSVGKAFWELKRTGDVRFALEMNPADVQTDEEMYIYEE